MESFPNFPEDSSSLIKKHLTKEIFESIKNRTTESGAGLDRIIASGMANPDSSIGLYAMDAESYQTFSPIFDPIILDYHHYDTSETQPMQLPSEIDFEGWRDPENLVKSVRIRAGRNVQGFNFAGFMSEGERLALEDQVHVALSQLEGELKGEYYPLTLLTEKQQQSLRDSHLLFQEGDRFLEAAGINQDWPQGRGIYLTENREFIVWVNEEDQLRIISLCQGGDLIKTYRILASALKKLEELLHFQWTSHLGYLTSCPTNLGTGIRASVHIHLPKLSKHPETMQELAREHDIQIRGTGGEHTESKGQIFDLSNKKRLGVSELQCVECLAEGVQAFLDIENQLVQ